MKSLKNTILSFFKNKQKYNFQSKEKINKNIY